MQSNDNQQFHQKGKKLREFIKRAAAVPFVQQGNMLAKQGNMLAKQR